MRNSPPLASLFLPCPSSPSSPPSPSAPQNVLVTGHEDGIVKLWSVDTGSAAFLKGHRGPVTAMCAAPTSAAGIEEALVTVSADGFMSIWSVPSQTARKPRMEDKINAHPGKEVGGSGGWHRSARRQPSDG